MKRKSITTIMTILFLASIFTVVFETRASPGIELYYDDGECNLDYPAIHSGQYLRQRFRVSDFDIDDNCLVETVHIFWYGTDPDFTGVIKLRDHDTGDLITAANLANVETNPSGVWINISVYESGFISDHFYVELWQTSPSPSGGLIMGDTDDLQYMSEVSTNNGETWVVWSMFNFMIRVTVKQIPAGVELLYYDDDEFDGTYMVISSTQYLRQRFLLSDFNIDEPCRVETVLISWLSTTSDFTGVIKLRDYETGDLVTVLNLVYIQHGSGPPSQWYNYYVAGSNFISDHFYVELWQTSPSPSGGLIRTDKDDPEGMSEISSNSGETWHVSSTLNFMIRATVSPLTPVERTKVLVETIETWNLPGGTESCLNSKLEAATHLLNPNNEIGAVNKLRDFIHQVQVFRDKKLTSEQAEYLIAEAQEIINKIQE